MFHPLVKQQINTLTQYDSVMFRFTNERKSSSEEISYSDRFTVSFQYCKTTINWDILFNSLKPDLPPDIIFLDPQSEINALDYYDIDSIKSWNSEYPQSLLNVLLEMIGLLSTQQEETITNYPNERLKFEFDLVKQIDYVKIEYSTAIINNEFKVYFMIPLTGLSPSSVFGKGTKIKEPKLLVTFTPNDAVLNPKTSLEFEPEWAKILSNVKLPHWSIELCITDYIPLVNESVSKLYQKFIKRKLLLEGIASIFGHPSEYDSINFRKITFLFDVDKYPFFAHIYLPINFPDDHPIISLQSLFHAKDGRPFTSQLARYPYSPRWGTEEMSGRITGCISTAMKNFRDMCNNDK
eukprot:TRINITY_DN11530_c0_g1_i1.p1 TRINITY_DN11530_c0_g1~~TRINITY_DN11530_c0_g1_i1.p1  ORF type:complete len:351 (+),score=54.74 TRINITY_DN11530_c0_g1_i1:150-1202(+)